MLKNYFKTAWRNIWKNKTFSAINIFGLAVGVAAFLLIVNYLRFEYSYDDQHIKKDRIFRVPMVVSEKDGLVERATNNIPNLKATQAAYVNVYDVMNSDTIIISQKALELINSWLGVRK